MGSGLGQFSRAMARESGRPVLGIERSDEQIAEAVRQIRSKRPLVRPSVSRLERKKTAPCRCSRSFIASDDVEEKLGKENEDVEGIIDNGSG